MKCEASFCANKQSKTVGIGYFHFSSNITVRESWVRFCEREAAYEPLAGHRLCSVHFNNEDIIIRNGKICCKKNVYPAIRNESVSVTAIVSIAAADYEKRFFSLVRSFRNTKSSTWKANGMFPEK
jgi:hypothetical protein